MRRLLAPLVAAVLLLLPVTAGARPRNLLPDLAQGAPTNVSIAVDRAGAQPRTLLAFQVTIANVGTGPLIVAGRRTAGSPTMTAHQLIRRSDGSTVTRSRPAGTMRYATDLHHHWHLLGFDRFELWSLNATRRLRSQSEGFCVSDSFRPFKRPIPHQPSAPAFRNNCGTGQPELPSIVEGISVGWGDDATPLTSRLDVTGLAAGRDLLVQRVDPAHRLLELNPFNDVACTPIALHVPRAAGAAPTVAAIHRRSLCTRTAARWDAAPRR